MSNEAEKIGNHSCNCCLHSLLNTDIHVLKSYTSKEEKSNTDGSNI